MRSVWRGIIPILAAALVAGCGAPGVQVAAPTPAQPSAADLQATVAAQVKATIQAQPKPSSAPQATPPSEPGTAPQAAERPTVAGDAGEPTVSTLQVPTFEAVTPEATPGGSLNTGLPQAADSGDMAIAVGRNGSVSVLAGADWAVANVKLADGNGCESARAAFASTGAALVGCGGRVGVSQDGQSWQTPESLFSHTRLFGSSNGRLYAFGFSDVQVFDSGAAATYTAAAAIKEDSFDVIAAAFSPDGTAYFSQSSIKDNLLLSFDGKSWKTYGKNIGLGQNLEASALLYTSKGELLAGDSEGVYLFDGATFKPYIDQQAFAKAAGDNIAPGVTQLAETPDGIIWIGTRDEGIFAWKGSQLSAQGHKSGLPSMKITDLKVDANGSLWAATTYGIAVWQGGKWLIGLPSTSGLGDSYITSIATKGAPSLPAAAAQPKTATISGRITDSHSPLAGAVVELCSEEPTITSRPDERSNTPCGNHTFHKTTKTDAAGIYRFENIPIGSYTIAVDDNTQGQTVIPSQLIIPALVPGKEITQDLNIGS